MEGAAEAYGHLLQREKQRSYVVRKHSAFTGHGQVLGQQGRD